LSRIGPSVTSPRTASPVTAVSIIVSWAGCQGSLPVLVFWCFLIYLWGTSGISLCFILYVPFFFFFLHIVSSSIVTFLHSYSQQSLFPWLLSSELFSGFRGSIWRKKSNFFLHPFLSSSCHWHLKADLWTVTLNKLHKLTNNLIVQ
jgi:hypothetical protein